MKTLGWIPICINIQEQSVHASGTFMQTQKSQCCGPELYIKKKDYENYQSEIEMKFQQDRKEIAAIYHFPSAKTN